MEEAHVQQWTSDNDVMNWQMARSMLRHRNISKMELAGDAYALWRHVQPNTTSKVAYVLWRYIRHPEMTAGFGKLLLHRWQSTQQYINVLLLFVKFKFHSIYKKPITLFYSLNRYTTQSTNCSVDRASCTE